VSLLSIESGVVAVQLKLIQQSSDISKDELSVAGGPRLFGHSERILEPAGRRGILVSRRQPSVVVEPS